MSDWYGMTRDQQCDLITTIAYNLTVGDDNNIHLSNLSREKLEAYGIDEELLFNALVDIAESWLYPCQTP